MFANACWTKSPRPITGCGFIYCGPSAEPLHASYRSSRGFLMCFCTAAFSVAVGKLPADQKPLFAHVSELARLDRR